jgi:hypothetical protein
VSPLAEALAAGAPPEPAAEPRRLTVGDLCRRWRCSRQTIERRIRDATLPPPLCLLERRVWDLPDVEAAERAMHARHAASGAGGMAAARRAAAKAAEARMLENLEEAAAAFLARKSVGDLARVLGRFAGDGRIASIPPPRRSFALRALRGGR